jgi:hypothetical protein
MPREPEHWRPRVIRRFIESVRSATSVARVETDAGEGFVKALGNPAGPHALACEWIGTQLAEWFGLPTLDYALIEVTTDDEIPLFGGHQALPGPAFITRAEKAYSWGGGIASLKRLGNPADIAKLVTFDTWTRNCDRCPADLTQRNPHRDNVLLSRAGAIETIRDPGVFGLFPEFRPLLTEAQVRQACARLRTITRRQVETIVASVPAAWAVEDSARQALADLLFRRADFVAGTLVGAIFGQGDLGLD